MRTVKHFDLVQIAIYIYTYICKKNLRYLREKSLARYDKQTLQG